MCSRRVACVIWLLKQNAWNRAGRGGGAAAGADDEDDEGASTEKAGTGRPSNAAGTTGTDSAGTEKLSSPSNQSGESESAPAM